MDTIFALATVAGKSGIAVVRLSGPLSHDTCAALCGDVPDHRGVRRVVDPISGAHLDEALILTFDKGRSFTGEQVIEFHLHGSRAIVASVLRSLGEREGLRAANPGEFTRRALENGRLDLSEVEGLADLIDAETESQHRQAMRVFSGDLGRLAHKWRDQLIRAAALLEATIDFADEDVPEDVLPEVEGILGSLKMELTQQIDGVKSAERIRDGFEVAIVGKPNVGKSTLLNYLAGRDAAITSDVPGTTRDVIEVRMEIGGYAVTLLDTAGVRETVDEVEKIGVDRARDRANAADLRVSLCEPGDDLDLGFRDQDIVVRPKSDLYISSEPSVSGQTGEGVDALLDQIENRLSTMVGNAGIAIRDRHRKAMSETIKVLDRALTMIGAEESLDLIAAELRFGLFAISSIVGDVDVEDLLGEIFSSFCIGK